MIKKFICLLAAAIVPSAPTVFAQENAAKAPVGTLTLEKKTYPLKHALAYETTIDNEGAIAVVLSGQKVTSESLKEARESEKEGNAGDFDRPFLKLIFIKKTGEFKFWSAGAGGTSIGRRSGSATGQLKSQGGRVSGKATQQVEADEMFPANSSPGRSKGSTERAGDNHRLGYDGRLRRNRSLRNHLPRGAGKSSGGSRRPLHQLALFQALQECSSRSGLIPATTLKNIRDA